MNDIPIQALLVEDNPADARLVEAYLKDAARAGHRGRRVELENAAKLSEAIKRVATRRFDIILLDLSLPDSSGLATLGRLLAHAPSIPVVVMSGTGDESVALQAVVEGAQDYLVKGRFDSALLVREIHFAIERNRVERALRESEARFRQAAEQIGELFWIATPDLSAILYLSPAFERITGRPARDAYEHPALCLEIVHPEEREALIADVRKCLATLKAAALEFRITRPDGETRWLRGRMAPVLNGAGELLRMVGIVEDVSEHQKLGEQLRQTQKMDAIGRLTAGLAHDFNNVLTLIHGHAEFALGRDGLPPESRDSLAVIGAAAERASALTRQLLMFSQPRAPAARLVDPNEIVTAMARMLGRLLGSDISLNTELAASIGRVRIDPAQLEQVLLNLTVNARDAMARGGVLTLKTERVGPHPSAGGAGADWVRLSVIDTGTGMDPATQARIFEPFFTTKPAGRGTGIGLATVFEIVRQAGGHIEVDSTPGRGSAFHIRMERHPAAPAAVPVASAPPEPAPPGRGTVLLVEDDPDLGRLLSASLGQHGYRVIAASSGSEALFAAGRAAAGIDLLITDFIMPGMNGHELAQKLRASRPDMKCLFMSGHAGSTIKEKGIDLQGHLLEKPFPPSRLIAKVRDVLEETARPEAVNGDRG